MSVAAGGAGDGGAGAGAGGAAAGGNAAAGGTPAAGSGTPGAGAGNVPAPGAGADWTSGLPELTRGFVQNKGFKGPEDLVTSYQNLEKHFGVPADRLVTLPKDETDAEGWGKVYGRLGRPEKPEGYGFKDKDGKQTPFQTWAEKTFHENGLSGKQAQALVQKYDAFHAEHQKAQENAFNQKVEQEISGLKSEWGMAHDQHIKQAQAAFKTLGVPDAAVDALERQLGYSATMKLFQKIGAKMGESEFVSGDRGDSFGAAMTPEAAKAKIQELKSDKEFTKAWAAGGTKEKAELDRLHRFANPT